MSTVIVKDNKITYSDWEERNQSQTPYNVENRKGQISGLVILVLIVVGLYYLISLF